MFSVAQSTIVMSTDPKITLKVFHLHLKIVQMGVESHNRCASLVCKFSLLRLLETKLTELQVRALKEQRCTLCVCLQSS